MNKDSAKEMLRESIESIQHTTMGINDNTLRCKYDEDLALKEALEYITSTYQGHYTSKKTNVQTLDLIEAVGDAPAFCRSNAIKYLSRYDKKGFPSRDILKAIHYCVLLYHFTEKQREDTEPYETF
jgi:hypothetical protein|tara:strand:- start:367 stop:744 length:378 start_codon:yes stop_codon:yes gene_type:complete